MDWRKVVLGAAGLSLAVGGIGGGRQHTARLTGFTTQQRQVADEIISIFENDTPKLRYDYIENLHDGRGFTAGRAGFCSADTDMSSVVAEYVLASPGNPLMKYLPLLRQKAKAGDDSIQDLLDLGPFARDWKTAATDPGFRKAQDRVVDQQVYLPGVGHWKHEGCVTPLALLVLYDTEVEHGDAKDPDGTPALIQATDDRCGGNPASGVEEAGWLEKFLSIRRNVLVDPFDPKTQEAWSRSVSRVDTLQGLLKAGNYNLKAPMEFNVGEERWKISDAGAAKLPDPDDGN